MNNCKLFGKTYFNHIYKNFPYINNEEELSKFRNAIYRFYKLNYKYQRELKNPKIIWQVDNVNLLSYGRANADKQVLIIPSIINNYYILDLKKNKSLARFLAQDFAVYIIDWSNSSFSCFEDYINTAAEIIKYLTKQNKISVIGHCLGGIIAIALCNIIENKIKNLTLLATPYDFAKLYKINKYISYKNYKIFQKYFFLEKNIEGAFIWLFFIFLYQHEIYKKYIKFGITRNKAEINLFLAIENWLNDYQSLDKRVVEYVMYNFFIKNKLYKNQWCISSGAHIKINNINIPSLVVIAEKDQIVNKESVELLSRNLNNSTIINVNTGHIGMIIGKKCKSELWFPLKNWLISN